MISQVLIGQTDPISWKQQLISWEEDLIPLWVPVN